MKSIICLMIIFVSQPLHAQARLTGKDQVVALKDEKEAIRISFLHQAGVYRLKKNMSSFKAHRALLEESLKSHQELKFEADPVYLYIEKISKD